MHLSKSTAIMVIIHLSKSSDHDNYQVLSHVVQTPPLPKKKTHLGNIEKYNIQMFYI